MYETLTDLQRGRLQNGLSRQLRRRLLITANREDKEAIRTVMNDDFLMSLLSMEASAVYANVEQAESPFVDAILKMLMFFIDNWEIILEIIRAISGSHL